MRRLSLLALLLAAACGGPDDGSTGPGDEPQLQADVPTLDGPSHSKGALRETGRIGMPPPKPDCRLTPESARFGIVTPGASATVEIAVVNRGAWPCAVTEVEPVGTAEMTVTPTEDVVVEPGSAQPYELQLPAMEPGTTAEVRFVIDGEEELFSIEIPEPSPAD